MYAVEARMKLHRKYTFYTNLVHIKRNVQKHFKEVKNNTADVTNASRS